MQLKWQEQEYPCVDAMAFYRNHELLTFDKIVSTKVSGYYNYDSLQQLYNDNISTVSLSTLVNDGITLPPNYTRKRQAGRPKKKRLRKRSKYEKPEDSIIVCSICNQHGHNKRTCETRRALNNIKLNLEQQNDNDNENNISDAQLALAMDPGYENNLM